MTRSNRNASWQGMNWIRQDKRLAIYLRDRFTCLICGKDLHNAAPMDLTLDHAKPWSKGGHNDSSNVYTCCKQCNCSRQNEALFQTVSADRLAFIRKQLRLSISKARCLARSIIDGEISKYEALQHTKGL